LPDFPAPDFARRFALRQSAGAALFAQRRRIAAQGDLFILSIEFYQPSLRQVPHGQINVVTVEPANFPERL
jgi:hypothetical protein